MTRAIVYVPSDQVEHGARCVAYCEQQGYELAGIVHNNLIAALALIVEQKASTLVVASDEDLAQERRPRIEVVASQPTPRGERRSRIIRRRNAAK